MPRSRIVFLLACIALLHAFAISAQEKQAPPIKLAGGDWQEISDHALSYASAIHYASPSGDAMGYFDGIRVLLVVAADGHVQSAQAEDGPEGLRAQAEQNMLRCSFRPFLRNGVAVPVTFESSVAVYPLERWASPHVAFPVVKHWNSVHISLARTSCYGACPAYSVMIDGDGTVTYNSDALASAVLISGKHTAHIPQQRVKSLIDLARKADYFSLEREYREDITDNPTETTSISIDGSTWQVIDYAGQGVGMPDAVKDLEEEIDKAADTARWITGDAETEPSLRAEKWNFTTPSMDNIMIFDGAIQFHNEPLIEAYFAAHVSLEAFQFSPLVAAVSVRDDLLVQRMLSLEPHLSPDALQSCLKAAIGSGDIALMQLFIDRGADPTKRTPANLDQTSLLAEAVRSKNTDVVAKLLKYKVDLTEPAFRGAPILSYALEDYGNTKIVRMLIDAGADVNAVDSEGATPLMATCGTEEIRMLLAAGANVNAKDKQGDTALLHCAFVTDAVQELLKDGADPSGGNGRKITPLQSARNSSCPKCAAMITEALEKRGLPVQ